MALTSQQIRTLRKRCQEDLYFLGKEVCGKDFEEKPHREMCDFFPKKTGDKTVFNWDDTKYRLMIISRGAFKSSIDVLDCVQATICDPNIRILILTAEQNLADAFVEEYKSYFEVIEGATTDFQQLFPEFCVAASKKGKANEFTSPARTKYKKEPTVWANSIGSHLPGWHCDILKADDVVTNKNAAEAEQIEKTIRDFTFAAKLVDPGGYIDVIGTPYAPNDLYDYLPKHIDEKDIKILIRPAYTLKPEAKNKPQATVTENDIEDYLFPSRLNWKQLQKYRRLDPLTFDSQYLLNARSSGKYLFTEGLVVGSILPYQAIPQQLKYYASWDLNYKNGIGNNYTAGAVIAIDEQARMYLIDLVWGHFSTGELTFQIADVIRRHPIQLTAIEGVNGTEWLAPEIERACVKLGVKPAIHWLPVDTSKNAKTMRIMQLAPLMEQRRFFISNACPNIDDIVSQFTNFNGSKNGTDDIPDAVSFVPRFVNINPGQHQDAKQFEAEWEKMRQAEMHRLLYPVSDPTPVVIDNRDQCEEPSYNNYF